MTPSMVSYRVRKALGGVGTVHQLRHSFACANYAINGHDIVAVQELLGHTSGYLCSDRRVLGLR